MIGSLASVVAVATVGQVYSVNAPNSSDRPIATIAPYPSGMADDVRRPGFNGRLWVSRPVIGGMQGPYPLGWDSPGPEAYGAFDNQSAVVYAKSGHVIVALSPWVRVEPEGLKRLEEARNFWLKERGYVGGVRTFVNDLYLYKQADEATSDAGAAPQASAEPKQPGAIPEPILKFEVPSDIPRGRSRIRVHGNGNDAPVAEARISWPMNAPADVVARSATTVPATTVADAKK